jgi:hypothetical protein
MKKENTLSKKDIISDGRITQHFNKETDSVTSQTYNGDSILDQLNHQLERLSEIIKRYNFYKFKDKAGQLDCICAMMEQMISENNRFRLLQFIHHTGYENIQRAFISLNQVCEESFREEENIFGILKRHRLNYPVPENDSLKFYRISQFLNVTLIHYHLQKRRGLNLTDLQQKIKCESAKILKPFLEKLIASLKKEIQIVW